MNRKQLKAQAKTLIRTAEPKPVVTAIVYLLIIALLSFLSMQLLSDVTDTAAVIYNNIYEDYYFTGGTNLDEYIYQLSELSPSPIVELLETTIGIVTAMLGAGFTLFCLKTARGTQASVWNLFDSFAQFGKLLCLFILESVFVALWSLLLIVPGIIAAYRYRMAIYILFDNPELSARECIRRSKELMRGRKWELFVLDLSFILWYLLIGVVSALGEQLVGSSGSLFATFLAAVGLGTIVNFYVTPYVELTRAGWYLKLTTPEPEQFFDEPWNSEV